jgi:formylglycine-generating enzyme required for sulfatase activity
LLFTLSYFKTKATVKTFIAILFVVIFVNDIPAQQIQFFLQGKVLDAKTKRPLSSATIRVPSYGLEASSNSEGAFSLQVKGSGRDSLEVSHIGYKTLKKSITDLRNEETFLLEDFTIQLKTLTVTSRKLNLKKIDGSLRVVKDNLYAYETETTNGLYTLFLNYLEEDGQTEIFQQCNFDLSSYDEKAKSFFKAYTSTYHLQSDKKDTTIKDYTDYPVVNVRHEAAIFFCQWLTEQYNNAPGKKKFTKVKFKLPSLKEWQIAALGYPKFQSWNLDENKVETVIPPDTVSELRKGKKTSIPVNEEILYPWWPAYNYRSKPQNHMNCFLGNFKIVNNPNPCRGQLPGYDGWTKQARTATYFPNDMGLYDVVGNVAEMIDEKGKACGGSWNDPPKESTIRSIKRYDKPDDTIGFRVFMDVIEE